MKTTNNVQKAILKSLAVVVSFILISFTVNAQGFWESLLENSSFNEIALAMAESNTETNQAPAEADMDAFASLLEEEAEESLELEEWMTNETNFTSSFAIEEEIESPLEVEEWMKDESYFSATSMSFEVETEESLEIENWMLDSENFYTENEETKSNSQPKFITGENYYFEHMDDYELKLELWMTDNRIWNN